MLSLITSALGWKTIFRKQMLNKIFWDGSINVIFAKRSVLGGYRSNISSYRKAIILEMFGTRGGKNRKVKTLEEI